MDVRANVAPDASNTLFEIDMSSLLWLAENLSKTLHPPCCPAPAYALAHRIGLNVATKRRGNN
jgi:hypothetical protein